jgi:aspartate aminotransferase-like enzyme
VTGVAATEVRTDDWGLDFVLTGSQKALALPPGLSFAVASPAMLDRSAQATHKGHYFDLVALVKSLENFQTPSTPAISLLYALEVQLERIRAEGIEQRWARHAAMREATVEWVERRRAAGVEVDLYAPAGHRSPTVTCITLPEGVSGPDVVAAMRERGWVIGGGYARLKETTVRIGHMGDHDLDNLGRLLDDLSEVLG